LFAASQGATNLERRGWMTREEEAEKEDEEEEVEEEEE